MLRLLSRDNENATADTETLYYYIVGVAGVIDCDYDGHFGPNVFVEIDIDFDTPATIEKIKQVISDYIEGNL